MLLPALEELFSAEVMVEQMLPTEAREGLYPEEEQAVVKAVEKRRREYIAGRLCARRALSRLGLSPAPLLNGEDRAPIWPRGVCGSISHTDSLCIVAAARIGRLLSVGVDVENDAGLKPELESRICTEAERSAMQDLDATERAARGKLIFSAKECAYKCQYPLTRTYLGFHAMEIELDPAAKTFAAIFQKDVEGFRRGDRLLGRYQVDAGVVATAAELRR